MTPHPPQLDLVFWHAPRIGEGFMERLETWVDEHPEGPPDYRGYFWKGAAGAGAGWGLCR